MIRMHEFANAEAQAEALADAVAGALSGTLAARTAGRRVTLAVSGGTSPRRFLTRLASRAVDWTRLDLTLVDDRWVGPDDADSNQRLVRETLLQGPAAAARFLPLVEPALDARAGAEALNRAGVPALPDVAVLGMGEDGHTASLFADAPEWPAVLSTPARFVAVHPGAAPHARISLSLQALLAIDHLFLQIGQGAKRAVLERARSEPGDNAISKLIANRSQDLDVYAFA